MCVSERETEQKSKKMINTTFRRPVAPGRESGGWEEEEQQRDVIYQQ